MGSPFILRTAVIYLIGNEYLGLDSLFTSILQMLNMAELGVGSAIVFSMYKPLADNKTDVVCALLGLYRKIYRIIGFLVLGISIAIVPILPRLIKSGIPEDVNLYVLYSLFVINTVLGYWMFAYKKSILSACQREDILSKVSTTIVLFKSIIQIILLFGFHNYYIYLIVMPIATIVENITADMITRRLFPIYVPSGKVQKDKIKNIKKSIRGLMIQRICSTSRNAMDNIIISAYIGLSMVTIYGNYIYIILAIHGILSGMANSILGVVGNTVAKNTPESNYKDMMLFNFMYMIPASFCTVLLLCVFQPFMTIWMGEDMLFPMSIVILICVYFYSLCIGDIRSTYYNACGLWYEGRFRSIAEALSNLILNIVLGRVLGITGIIIATLFSIIIINFGYGSTIIHRYYFKGISSAFFYFTHIYYAFVTALGCAVSYKICIRINLSGMVQIIINGLICLIVMSLVMILFYHRLSVFKQSIFFIKRAKAK